MYKIVLFLFLISSATIAKPTAPEDPFLWLEDSQSSKVADWVKAENQKTLGDLENDVRFAKFKQEAENILTSKERIPYGMALGDYYYNLWQDEKSTRGIWRRVKLTELGKKTPPWEVLLDIDELAKKENQDWVFKNADCLPPQYKLCMLSLSLGGKDATTVREFNVADKAFVADGFRLSEARNTTVWVDENTLLIATKDGDRSLTEAGYPRVIKKWTRGKTPTDAQEIYEGKKTDVKATVTRHEHGDKKIFLVHRLLDLYHSEKWILRDNGDRVQLPVPNDAEVVGYFKDQILLRLQSAWSEGGQTFAAGNVLSFSVPTLLEKNKIADLRVAYTPDATSTVRDVSTTSRSVLVSILHNVRANVLSLDLTDGKWHSTSIKIPTNGAIRLVSASGERPEFLVTYESFLTPTSLYLFDSVDSKPKLVKQLPAQFDSRGLTSEQRWAVSRDGTRVPYFIVGRNVDKKKTFNTGKNPVMMYGYGGFEISMVPLYLGSVGKLWLEKGGVYVLANIRGGGEFGPGWHQAALKENRQRAFDDFLAVAYKLIEDGVTSSKHLGIVGRSNGGLLVGTAMTQRPELFGAVICGSPLLDMIRYPKLFVGSAYVAEYGDPEDKKLRPAIEKYSPYQNLRKESPYPKAFFYSSANDDRVHPGHARKMVAKLLSFEKPVYYFENDGGHSAGNSPVERARRTALEFVYLHRQIMNNEKK